MSGQTMEELLGVPPMQQPKPLKFVARCQGKEYNPKLDLEGDLTFHYPDNAGKRVSRMLTEVFTDALLLEIQQAGYDLKTLRISISKKAQS